MIGPFICLYNIECSVNQQLASQKKLEQIYFTRISLSSLGDTNHDYDVGKVCAGPVFDF